MGKFLLYPLYSGNINRKQNTENRSRKTENDKSQKSGGKIRNNFEFSKKQMLKTQRITNHPHPEKRHQDEDATQWRIKKMHSSFVVSSKATTENGKQSQSGKTEDRRRKADDRRKNAKQSQFCRKLFDDKEIDGYLRGFSQEKQSQSVTKEDRRPNTEDRKKWKTKPIRKNRGQKTEGR